MIDKNIKQARVQEQGTKKKMKWLNYYFTRLFDGRVRTQSHIKPLVKTCVEKAHNFAEYNFTCAESIFESDLSLIHI